MPLVVRAFPVLPGKEEDIRRIAAEMAGPRREEAQEFFRHFGIIRESWHYQETPHGPLVIGVTEVEEPDAKAREYARVQPPLRPLVQGPGPEPDRNRSRYPAPGTPDRDDLRHAR